MQHARSTILFSLFLSIYQFFSSVLHAFSKLLSRSQTNFTVNPVSLFIILIPPSHCRPHFVIPHILLFPLPLLSSLTCDLPISSSVAPSLINDVTIMTQGWLTDSIVGFHGWILYPPPFHDLLFRFSSRSSGNFVLATFFTSFFIFFI